MFIKYYIDVSKCGLHKHSFISINVKVNTYVEKTQKAGKLPLSALFTGVPTLKYSPFLLEFAPSQTFYCLIHCIYYFRTGNTRDDVDNVTKQENKVLFCHCKQMPETIMS